MRCWCTRLDCSSTWARGALGVFWSAKSTNALEKSALWRRSLIKWVCAKESLPEWSLLRSQKRQLSKTTVHSLAFQLIVQVMARTDQGQQGAIVLPGKLKMKSWIICCLKTGSIRTSTRSLTSSVLAAWAGKTSSSSSSRRIRRSTRLEQSTSWRVP